MNVRARVIAGVAVSLDVRDGDKKRKVCVHTKHYRLPKRKSASFAQKEERKNVYHLYRGNRRRRKRKKKKNKSAILFDASKMMAVSAIVMRVTAPRQEANQFLKKYFHKCACT